MGLAIDTLTKEKPQNLKLPWKRLFGFAYKLKLRFVVAAIAGVIGTAASVAFPILIGQGISGVVESGLWNCDQSRSLMNCVIFFADLLFRSWG